MFKNLEVGFAINLLQPTHKIALTQKFKQFLCTTVQQCE